MANNIVNGGAIVLVAAVGLAAIVGGLDEFRALSGPPEGGDGAGAASADHEPEPSVIPDLDRRLPQGIGADRDDDRSLGEDQRHDAQDEDKGERKHDKEEGKDKEKDEEDKEKDEEDDEDDG